MTAVMAYVTLIAAGVGACAFVGETVLRSRAKAGRWVWVGALLLTAVATVLAIVVPRPSIERASNKLVLIESASIRTDQLVAPSTDVPRFDVNALFGVADIVLPLAWLVLSAALLITIGVGRSKLNRERVRAKRAQLAGHRVLVTDNVGPAVAGIREPVVLVPQWVFALDDPSQRLLMAHEMEHVRRRDTALLFAGATSAALMPWNPVVWWMVGRLRLAVEQDCDARVLAAHPGVRRYADLLLTAASRHGLTSRLLAAHFGEHTSDLLRRIEAMTNRDKMPWRKLVAAAVAAVALIAVACETPRPDPVAPINLPATTPSAPTLTLDSSSAQIEQVPNVIVYSSDGRELARYQGEIPVAHLPPDGIQRINVMNDGICAPMSCPLIRITLKQDASLQKQPLQVASNVKGLKMMEVPVDSSHYHYAEVKKTPLSSSALERVRKTGEFLELRADSFRFESSKAVRGGRSTFNGIAPPPPPVRGDGEVPVRLVERDGTRFASGIGTTNLPSRIVLRGRTGPSMDPPNVIVLSSEGTELLRILATELNTKGRTAFEEIRTDDIESIEVQKGRQCAPLACPLLKITMMPGRDAKYRK